VRLAIAAVLLVGSVAAAAYGDVPTLQFGGADVRLQGATPGARFTWVAMGRDNSAHNAQLRIVRGLASADGQGGYDLGFKLDPLYSVWAVAAVDEPWTLLETRSGCPLSPQVIEVTAAAGATRFTVTSGIIHGNYVRPNGSSWTFTATDGSSADGDGTPNGRIEIVLATLAKFTASGDLPAAIQAGDKLLLLDPHQLRARIFEVAP